MKKFKYTVFSTKNNNYLYDGVSGNIFNIEESILNNHTEIFKSILNGKYPEDMNLKSNYEEVLDAIKSSCILKASKKPFEYWFNLDNYKRDFNNDIKHLMVGVTEKCNMRCKYCIYGGHYENERIHGEIDMNFDTLKQSVDFFLNMSNSSDKIINLYGGEPFINFKTIEKIVDYIENIDNTIQFYITTNGVLLDEHIMNWFSNKKNIHLFVSLAGVPNKHDELRVLANNKPTYETIKNNLLYLKKVDIESYCNRINFVFNLFDEIQLIELNKYWETDELFKGLKGKPEITFIDCADDDGHIKKLRENVIGTYSKDIEPLEEYIQLLKEQKYDNLIVQYFDNKLLHIHKRQTGCNKNTLSGVCRPFVHKMFVDVHGNLNICENFVYGTNFNTIKEEFSINNVDTLLTIYKNERNKTCSDCWATKLCSLCFRDLFDRNAEINHIRANEICEYERTAMLETLIEYCSVLEHDDELLDHLDEYIIHA